MENLPEPRHLEAMRAAEIGGEPLTKTDLVVGGLLDFSWPLMRPSFAHDNACVAMSRHAVEVARYFNVPAKAVRVSAHLLNAEFLRQLNAGELTLDKPMTDENVEKGAWGIGLGLREPNKPMGGMHVAVVMGRWLVDLTLAQANRPERKIYAEASAFRIYDREWFQGKSSLAWSLPENGGIVYFYWPNDTIFKSQSPDWFDFNKRFKKPTGDVIRAIKEAL